MVLANKTKGKWRFCVDYRRLNAVTITDAYPIPRIDDAIESLSGAMYFSTMDAENVFWQIPMKKLDAIKTEFTTHEGQLEWVRMPMGLQNFPGRLIFQRLMNVVLSGLTWSMWLVYGDDIIVFNDTIEQNIVLLRSVCDRLQTAGISLSLEKCKFLHLEVPYLGFLIWNGEVTVNPEKYRAVTGIKARLTSQTYVRSFLGMCEVYRKFIKNYAVVIQPLVELTKSEHPSRWDETY